MATVPRAADPLPSLRGKIISASLTDSFNNIFNFLEAHTIDDANVDYSSSDGIGVLRFSQTFTGQKTFEDIIATSKQHKSTKIRVYNNSGGSISAGELIYVSAYNSDQSLYEVKKAVVTTSTTTTLYATLIADAAISNATAGDACTVFPLTGQNTGGLTVGRPVFLSTTAGAWTSSLPAAGNAVQVVGFVATVHASTGRVILVTPGSVIPWSLADQI